MGEGKVWRKKSDYFSDLLKLGTYTLSNSPSCLSLTNLVNNPIYPETNS